MKKTLLMTFVAALFSLQTTLAEAAILTLEAGPNAIEGVNVSKGGKTQVDTRSVALTTAGAGLRSKKVAFFTANVYVAQLLLSDVSKLVRNEADALASTQNIQTAALQLQFLRDVDADTVMTSFKDALSNNGVNLEDAAVKKFLEAVAKGGEAKEGKTLTIVMEKLAGGKEVVSYENNAGVATSIEGDAGLSRNLLSIWLGKPTDSGIEKLKKSLLGIK